MGGCGALASLNEGLPHWAMTPSIEQAAQLSSPASLI
ncbi:hypothetical protein MT49_1765 [Mycobacterium tuberculosis 49-02]|nr:hypothetical protein MT49_1765 [Mycobacterium tuberculosis 49-02]